MEQITQWLDLDHLASHLVRLGLAFVLAMPVAWDRERAARSLGLRTFPLVSMASAGYILVAQTVLGWDSPEQARIIQGLITGIGFLGGGAIVKQGLSVRGTATAASIWSTAAVGAAVAWHRYDIALSLTLTTFVALRFLKPLKEVVGDDEDGQEDG